MTLREYLTNLPQHPYREDAPLLRVREKSFRVSEIEAIKPEQIYCVLYKSDNPVQTGQGLFYIPVRCFFTQKPKGSELPSDDDMQALYGFLTQEETGVGQKLPQELVDEDERVNKQRQASVFQVRLAGPLFMPDESRDIPKHLTCEVGYQIHYLYF
jgi:hypothetical protein